jgi:glycosyltransferase involved in cell wall biosynthesis
MISIAMATYNGVRFLAEQIDSIISQTYSDFELIVCDDCSKDNTFALLVEYQKKDRRIHVFENEVNLGFKKNFEKAVGLCKGDFIAFCDQDDIWTENHLEVLVKNIGNKDLICGKAELVDENGISLGVSTSECFIPHAPSDDKSEVFEQLLYSNFVQGTAAMISRNLVQYLFPIPDCVRFHDWWAASISCLHNGLTYVDEVVLKYRQHGTNVTTTKKYSPLESIVTSVKRVFKKSDKLLNDYKDIVTYGNALRDKVTDENNMKAIDISVKYYTNLIENHRIRNIPTFFEKYKKIYWTRKPTFSMKIIRFIKIFILHM